MSFTPVCSNAVAERIIDAFFYTAAISESDFNRIADGALICFEVLVRKTFIFFDSHLVTRLVNAWIGCDIFCGPECLRRGEENFNIMFTNQAPECTEARSVDRFAFVDNCSTDFQ